MELSTGSWIGEPTNTQQLMIVDHVDAAREREREKPELQDELIRHSRGYGIPTTYSTVSKRKASRTIPRPFKT